MCDIMINLLKNLLITPMALALASPAQPNPQFCNQDNIFGMDLCVSASSHAWSEGEIHLIFSGAMNHDSGWAAFGPGSKMDNALMFVVYPSSSTECMVIFSL